MKKYLLLGVLMISLAAGAQQINLNKVQQITITSTANQDIDMMSMGMQMKNNTSSTGILEIKNGDNKNYNGIYKLSKISISMDAMGQQSSYDSEKPSDKESEIGKSVAGKVGKEIKVSINKNSGKATVDKNEAEIKTSTEDANPLKGLMESFGAADEGATVETAFFMMPAGKKAGDSWVDSVKTKEMKEVKTYTLKSITGSEAIIGIFSIMEGTSKVDAQGMQMDISISAKSEGEIIVDTKNSLVKKRSSVSDISGNIEMMGQSMPMTSKVSATTEYK